MKTNAEVNEELALLDGWHRDTAKNWYSSGSDLFVEGLLPPNYCSEWEHLGPLLKELVQAGSVDLSERGGMFFALSSIVWSDRSGSYESVGDTLTEAIAREVLAWSKEKESD